MQCTLCSRCHTVVYLGQGTCPGCSAPLRELGVERVQLCPRDGTPLRDGSRSCPTCGKALSRHLSARWFWLTGIVLASFVMAVLLLNGRHLIYSTYQPATCLITGHAINSTNYKDGTHYTPEFTYEVFLQNTSQPVRTESGDLGLGYSVELNRAQQTLQYFPVSKSFACVYSPLASPRTAIYPPDELNYTGTDLTIWFLGSLVLFSLAAWALSFLIIDPRNLLRRGVTTTGTIVGRSYYHGRYRSKTYSVVAYQTQTNPELGCRTTFGSVLQKGTSVTVIYDRLNPVKNVFVQDDARPLSMRGPLICFFIIIVVLLCFFGLLSIPAFRFG